MKQIESEMGLKQSRPVTVEGFAAPGYESVKEMFEKNCERGAEDSAQLCVYVEEKKVVDLWWSMSNPKYTGDTLTNVFSSTKSLTAIAMAALQDKGLISYDEKISTYWPEFGQNGKEDVTVADLMRHEAGLASLDNPPTFEDTWTENIKKNCLGSKIETEKCNYPTHGKGKREYHGISRGWIANEIFRRMDPGKRTIGEYLMEDVAKPLNADVYVGARNEKFEDYAPTVEIPMSSVLGESIKATFTDSAVDVDFISLLGVFNMLRKIYAGAGASKPAFQPNGVDDMTKIGPLFNMEAVRRGETSSANGNCSARGLALVAAAMANQGSINGVQVLSKQGCEALHKDPVEAPLFGIWPTNFTQGGVNKFDQASGRDGYYGWFGYGGSVFQWHPELKIGFAYTPTYLHAFDLTNNRGRMLQQEAVKCAKNMKN